MNSIIKIDNQIMEIIKEPAFYKLRVLVWGPCYCVLRAEKYAYNPKKYYGKKLKTYLNNKLKQFKKMLDDGCYWPLSDDEADGYSFDDDYSYEAVFSDKYGNDVNVILTPAIETFDLYLESEPDDKYIKDR